MQYTAYTVSVTNGSPIVTGAAGTAFVANVAVGNTFKVKDENVVYQVAAVNSDTQLTLSSNYAGATRGGLNYQITRDFTPHLGLAEISTGDIDWPYHLTQEVIRKLDTIIGDTSQVTLSNLTVTGDIVLGLQYRHISVDATLNDITVTLPDANSCAGSKFEITRIDGSAFVVTIAASAGQTIFGASTENVYQYETIVVYSNGVFWS